MIKITNEPLCPKLSQRSGQTFYFQRFATITLRAAFSAALLTSLVTTLMPLPQALMPLPQVQAQGLNQHQTTAIDSTAANQKLPLHGLTGTTSLGVYPTLDKGLLVTPGAHAVAVSVPLSEIIAGHNKVTGKIERQDLPRGQYQALLISVKNNADRPLLFDGDAAVADSTAGPLACVPLAKLEKLSVLPEQSSNFGKKFVTDLAATTSAAVTVGWYQTLRDQKRASGPVVGPDGGRYAEDEQRRTDQLRRFGKRVLWPGDTTSGVIYFDVTKPLADVTIILPIASYYDKNDQSTISLRR
jgi:hypothetical protein